jgi:iron-sulfur cluster repair protein YtfE (RIC family)
MKRSAELRDLSEEHHYGLVAARNLRLAAESGPPSPAAVGAFLAEWQGEIQVHFRSEEEVLLPQIAAVLGSRHELVVRTLTEHVEIRLAVRQLEGADEAASQSLAAQVARLLHDHIRFEERVLFPAVETQLAGDALRELGAALQEARADRDQAGPRCAALSSLSTKRPPSRMQ